jgi:hypothetical protein
MKNFALTILIVLSMLPVVGSTYTGATVFQKEEAAKVIKVYPTPASSTIFFEVLLHNGQEHEIIVYNFLGKKMDHLKNVGSRVQLNLDNYYSGIYLYQLRDKKGNLISSGKFNVVK